MLYPGAIKLKYTKLQYVLPLILNGCEILSVAPTEEQVTVFTIQFGENMGPQEGEVTVRMSKSYGLRVL
jgi:hypothetical protein